MCPHGTVDHHCRNNSEKFMIRIGIREFGAYDFVNVLRTYFVHHLKKMEVRQSALFAILLCRGGIAFGQKDVFSIRYMYLYIFK